MIVNLAKERLDREKLMGWLEQVQQELARQKIVPKYKRRAKDTCSLEINLVFVSKKRMQLLNRSFRDQNSVTDILSFYLDGGDSSFAFSQERSRLSGGQKRENSRSRTYGELVLCLPVIRQKAKELAFPEWLYYLIVHGVLHLYGFQHESSKEAAREMYRIQDRVFKKLSSKNKKR